MRQETQVEVLKTLLELRKRVGSAVGARARPQYQTEFAYYAMGRTHAELTRVLRRDERTIRDSLTSLAKLPCWVTEILRFNGWSCLIDSVKCLARLKSGKNTPDWVSLDRIVQCNFMWLLNVNLDL